MTMKDTDMPPKNTASPLEQLLTDVMSKIEAGSPDILGAAVTDNDGFIIASKIPRQIGEETVGGMCVTFLGSGEKVAEELGHESLEQAYLKTDRGYVILNSIDSKTILVLLANRDARLGLVFLLIRRYLAELQRIIGVKAESDYFTP